MSLPVSAFSKALAQTPLQPDIFLELRNVVVKLNYTLPPSELARLNHTLEHYLSDKLGCIVQFVSPHHSPESRSIAFETAISATLSGKRVLYIDAMLPTDEVGQALANSVEPLENIIANALPLSEGVVAISGSTLCYAMFHAKKEQGLTLTGYASIKILFDTLQPYFDLIVFNSPDILNDAFGAVFSKLANGSVLLVEAEKTRAPLVMQTRQMIESEGGSVIGTILSNRRLYIPEFLYRWLYKSHHKHS